MENGRVGVLFISPLPPPYGGIASWSEKVARIGLPEPFTGDFLDTSVGRRNLFEKSEINRAEVRRNWRIVRELAAALLKKRVAIVHLNCSLSAKGIVRDWLCAKMSIWAKVLVVHYHGDVGDFISGRLGGVMRFFVRGLARSAALNIVLNEASLAILTDIADSVRTVKLPNFIELTDGHRVGREERSDEIHVIYVGGLSPAKGLDVLLELPRRLPEVAFSFIGKPVAGGGAKVEEIGQLPNVHLLGGVSNTEVRRLLEQCDIFVLPSYSEGFPVSILEAMAAGLPVVASSVGAVPEMIDAGKGGFLCGPGDIDGVVSALELLLKDDDLRRKMGRYNLEKVRANFEYSVTIAKLCGYYREILQEA